MPYVSVHVDTRDVLDDLSDRELEEEFVRRNQAKGQLGAYSADYRIPQRAARYTLEEAADIFRRMGRTDLAFKLEEIRTDFVGQP